MPTPPPLSGWNLPDPADAEPGQEIVAIGAELDVSTVFAAYNDYAGDDREIDVYPYNGHEGGQGHQWVTQARWLAGRSR